MTKSMFIRLKMKQPVKGQDNGQQVNLAGAANLLNMS